MNKISNLFKIMEEREITQKTLSDSIGISQGNISDWKNGRSLPSGETISKLATYFNVTTDYLLGRTDISETITSDFTESEILHIKKYRPLSPESKKRVDNTLNFEYALWKKGQEGRITTIGEKDDYIYGQDVAFGGQTKETIITKEQNLNIHRLKKQIREEQENK